MSTDVVASAEPLFVWSPPRRRSDGDLAVDLAASMRLRGQPVVMDVLQRAYIEDVFAEGDEPGIPAAFAAVFIGPRQAVGKTAALIVCGLADLFVFDVWLHIWTAHLVRTSTGAFRDMRAMIGSNPDLKALCKWPPNTANGQQAIEMLSGQRLEFHARSTGGGRGLAGDRNTADEGLFLTEDDMDALLPTMTTIPHAQLRIGSSAGLGMSKVLRGYRDRGREGGDPRLAYHECGVPVTACADESCEHLDLADPGCVLNDRELWRRRIPNIGTRVREERIEDFRRNLSPRGFAREFYSWWDEPLEDDDPPIDAQAWGERGLDPGSPNAKTPVSAVAISVECTQDRMLSTIGLAARRADGKKQLELAARKKGTAWVVAWVVERVARHWPLAVAVDPSGPAGFLIQKLRDAGVEVLELTARDMQQASGDVQTAVNEDDVVHLRDAVLTASAITATKHRVGASWAFERNNPKADGSAILAVAEALHGLTHGSDGPSVYEERGLVVL